MLSTKSLKFLAAADNPLSVPNDAPAAASAAVATPASLIRKSIMPINIAPIATNIHSPKFCIRESVSC